MEANGHENDAGNGQVYVKFGPGKTQEIPIEWASWMLQSWRQTNAGQFRKALAEAAVEAK